MSDTYHHISVLSEELIAGLSPQSGGLYLDATVGGGGHSEKILAIPGTRVIALDQDTQAIAAAQTRLQPFAERITFWQGNFADYDPQDLKFDGILADLGVSSAQLDQPERGFSFRHEAPLDMRMNQNQALTAADLINTADERELADIFYHYGEERLSRRISRYIVANRPFETTIELASAVARVMPYRKSGRTRNPIHPATRVFQALRIAVNAELSSVETFLAKAPLWLHPGGRIGIISFHSLEDRITKHTLRATESLKVLTSKPIYAQSEEISQNPRSRSAKLRIAERR